MPYVWPNYPTGGGYWCSTCGRWVGTHEYHACGWQRQPTIAPTPTTTIITRPAPDPDQRLKFALELIEDADDLAEAKKLARRALGRDAIASANLESKENR